MKIYEFKCPSCGADLETDGSQRIVQCKYCRKALYIDYKTDPITVSIPDIEPEALTGLTLTLRRSAASDPIAAQVSLGDGVTYEGDNTWMVRIAPEKTENLEAGRYRYDLELRFGDDVLTALIGRMRIVQDVTW